MTQRNTTIKAVVEFIVPFLIEKGISVSRGKIRKFLSQNGVTDAFEFRKKFDHKDGLMKNFIKEYAGVE